MKFGIISINSQKFKEILIYIANLYILFFELKTVCIINIKAKISFNKICFKYSIKSKKYRKFDIELLFLSNSKLLFLNLN